MDTELLPSITRYDKIQYNHKMYWNMKKSFLLTACAVFLTLSSFAQTVIYEIPSKYPSVREFVSNGFWDNWEFSFGAGASTLCISNLVGSDDPKNFTDRIGFEANAAFTKWFHPVFGVRAQVAGGRFRNYTPEGLQRQRTPYIFVHTDLMINFSNWAGGYRDDRAYYAVPYVGFGYQATDFTDRSHKLGYGTNSTFAFTVGWLSQFRISRSWDFNIELRGWLFPGHEVASSLSDGSKYAAAYSATAGFSHRFGKRGWIRPVPQLFTEADIAKYTSALERMEQDLARSRSNEQNLAAQLAAANQALASRPARQTEEVFIDGAYAVFFNLNSADLSQRNKILLDMVAEEMAQSPSNKIYIVSGYADKETGTATYNMKLSERRAKAVSEYLRSKGVKASQMEIKAYGSSEQPFSGNIENNRVVVIR